MSHRCIYCLTPAESLYKKYGTSIKLTQCRQCHRDVDPYTEREWLLVSLDCILLRQAAYRHVLYNREALLGYPLSLILVGSFLQAFSLRTDHRLAAFLLGFVSLYLASQPNDGISTTTTTTTAITLPLALHAANLLLVNIWEEDTFWGCAFLVALYQYRALETLQAGGLWRLVLAQIPMVVTILQQFSSSSYSSLSNKLS